MGEKHHTSFGVSGEFIKIQSMSLLFILLGIEDVWVNAINNERSPSGFECKIPGLLTTIDIINQSVALPSLGL